MTDKGADHAAEIEHLKSEVSRLKGRVESLHTANGELRSRISAQQEKIRELRKRPSAVKATRAEIDGTYGAEHVRLLLGTSKRPRLSPEQLRRVETELASTTLEEVVGLFPDDRLLSNFVLNLWEWAHGKTALQSLPWNVSLPISDVCNARCSFCTSWFEGRHQLTLEQLESFEPVLRTAVYVGLIGHGEPLSHPRLGEIADRLSDYLDRRAASYTITNGVYLAKWFDRLDQLRLKSLSCSLNAATEGTHRSVMGLGAGDFPRIVDDLRALAAGQVTKKPVSVTITLVVTQQNIHEIPAFIELGNEIKATSIYVRTLLPQPGPVSGLNYHVLPPYLHPDFEKLRANAAAAIKGSVVPVIGDPDTWGNPVFPTDVSRRLDAAPPVFISRADVIRDSEARAHRAEYYASAGRTLRGEPSADPELADKLDDGSTPLGRHAPFRCRAVYNNLYVNELFFRVSPCCYLTNTPGYDEVRLKDVDLPGAWNAPSFRELRRRLAEGPLYGACQRCPENW
jgi:sulfatase maturation enzyme AslB (radical SAM superfamily)